MLIGHSNGTGFVASLAIELKNKTGENVSEMDTRDVPAATAAWGEVEWPSGIGRSSLELLHARRASLECRLLNGVR